MQWLKRARETSTTRQFMMAGAIVLVITIVLIVLYSQFFTTSYGVLFSRLRTMDAAAIVGELDRRKIPYRLEDGGSTVMVPQDLVDSTRLSVMSEELPLKGMVGFELFNKSDMGLTDFAQKINYQRALQGELARTIMTIAAVESARVHLSFSEPTIFRADRTPPKASVSITTRAGAALAADTVGGIQRLVAASVPELDPSNVIVLDARGHIASVNVVTADPDVLAPAMQQQQAIEAFYVSLVRQALARASYVNAATVNVKIVGMLSSDATIPGLNSTQEKRGYGLAVTLIPRRALADTVRSDMQTIAESAISADPSLGDVVRISAAQPLPASTASYPEPAAAVVVPEPGAPPRAQGDRAVPWATMFLGALALVVIGTLLVSRRRFLGAARLSREAYVSRFNSLIDEEDRDATKPA